MNPPKDFSEKARTLVLWSPKNVFPKTIPSDFLFYQGNSYQIPPGVFPRISKRIFQGFTPEIPPGISSRIPSEIIQITYSGIYPWTPPRTFSRTFRGILPRSSFGMILKTSPGILPMFFLKFSKRIPQESFKGIIREFSRILLENLQRFIQNFFDEKF